MIYCIVKNPCTPKNIKGGPILYQFLWIFFIYAFLGWCTEVSYAALNTGKFVNRGFLNGPVCPIYGFGVVIVLACLTPLKGNFVLLFLGSVVLTSALEWITGFLTFLKSCEIHHSNKKIRMKLNI